MEKIYLTAFFKFAKRGREFGFERMHLQHLWKTEQEARNHLSFCDEAGWYEGALIEERVFGWDLFKGKRVWFLQESDGSMKEIEEPEFYKNVVNIVS